LQIELDLENNMIVGLQPAEGGGKLIYGFPLRPQPDQTGQRKTEILASGFVLVDFIPLTRQ